jgi:hypothetical protein
VRRRLLAGLAAAGGGAGVGFVGAAGRASEAPPLRSGALSAEALADSIGVVVHFSYVDTAYGRQADVVTSLRELGVRHIREGTPPRSGPLASGLRAARAAGIRATLLPGDTERDPVAAVTDSIAVMGDHIDAFEGPNELDNIGDPAWVEKLSAYMPRLAAAVREHAPGVPVVGPSFVQPSSRVEVPADLPGLYNAHPYAGGGPPEPALGAAVREAGADDLDRGVVFTETGYHNALHATTGQPPTSERAAAVYLPRLLVTAFGAGVRRTFIYELLDEKPDPGLLDPEQHFGLLRQDFTPKPAYTAVQTLIRVLRASKRSRVPAPARLRVSAEGTVDRVTLERRDGSQVTALWRPVSVWDQDERQPTTVNPLRVHLRVDPAGRDVAIWRPSVSARPVLRRAEADRLAIDLYGDLVLVSVR